MDPLRIDAHAHGMHADRDASGKLCPPVRSVWTGDAQAAVDYVQESREKGIAQILILDPPHVAFALREAFGDFILPTPQVDLDHVTPADIDALFARGACGIKFISPSRPYGDDAYLPIYAAVEANRGLAVFHTGYLGTGMFGPNALLPRDTLVDITHMCPAAVDRVARFFPELNILLAHFGNPWWEECWKIMSSHPNVYADFSGGTAYRRCLRMWLDIFKPDGKTDVKAVSKLCFATDATYFVPGILSDIERYTGFYDRLLDALEVSDELREQVNYGNIRRLTEG